MSKSTKAQWCVSQLCSVISVLLLLCSMSVMAGNKLIGSAAVNQIEGSAGGGLVPWAVLSAYASEDESAVSAFTSHSKLDDYSLDTKGLAFNYRDRVELSYSRMTFGIDSGGSDIRLNVLGAKFRLYGDVIYTQLPQLSFGIQHKTVLDYAIPESIGSKSDSGTDFYFSASKVWLDGIAHHTVLFDLNARLSKSNQIGILGFGGDEGNNYKLSVEGAAGVFINRHLLVGIEYRQKSDHLSAVSEDNWVDIFVSYLPNKSLSLTAAYLNLGDIAGVSDQSGYYLSLQGAF